MTAVPLVDLAVAARRDRRRGRGGLRRGPRRRRFIGGKAVAAFEQEYAEFAGARALRRRRQRHRRPRARRCARSASAAATRSSSRRTPSSPPPRPSSAPAPDRCSSTSTTTHLLHRPRRGRGGAHRAHPRRRSRCDLYGQVAPFELLPTSLGERGIAVVEDAAQSQGATRHGRPPGRFGARRRHQLLPRQEPRRLRRRRRRHHRRRRPRRARCGCSARTAARRSTQHDTFGFNSRLDTLQAVVLRAKLRRLPRWNDAAPRRRRALRRAAGRRPRRPAARHRSPGNEHVWHLYVVRVPSRDAVLRAACTRSGIGAGHPLPRARCT